MGNRKPHSQRMQWEGDGSQPCPSPVLGQSSGSDSIAQVWLRGLPCQSLHTSLWMVSHLRYRLLHLLSFCLACRGWWGMVKPWTSQEWIYVQNLVCIPSVSRETYCPYPNPILAKCCSLGNLPEKTGETLTTFWWSFLLLKESRLFLSRHNSPLKIVFIQGSERLITSATSFLHRTSRNISGKKKFFRIFLFFSHNIWCWKFCCIIRRRLLKSSAVSQMQKETTFTRKTVSKLTVLFHLNASSAACSFSRAQKDKLVLSLSSNSKLYRKFVSAKNPILSPFDVSSVTVR